MILVGYVGPSKKEAHVRLYTGLDFQTYYEIPKGAVTAADAVDEDDENSPTQLTVTAETTIDLVHTSKQTGPASYLAGSIAAAYLAGAARRRSVRYRTGSPHLPAWLPPWAQQGRRVGPGARGYGGSLSDGVLRDDVPVPQPVPMALPHVVLCGGGAEQAAAYVVRSRIACTALPGCGGTNFHYHC